MREYSGGNYWDFFFQKIKMNSTVQRQTYLGKIFFKTLEHYHLIIKDEFDRKQYVQNILVHSFVTNNYMKDYFDFLLSFYNRNLLRNLHEDFSEDFYDLSDFIKSTLSGDDILRVEGSKDYPSSSYHLLKSTRYMIAYYPSVIGDEIRLHLEMLDQFYFDDVLPDGHDRFSSFFKSSYASILSTKIERRNGKRINTREHLNRSPYLILRDQNIFLRVPEQKFRDKEVLDQIHLNISAPNFSNSYALEAYRHMGIVISDKHEAQIPFESVFSKINVEIASEVTRCFEIPGKSYRLFDDNFNEISAFRVGFVYLLSSKEHFFSCDEKSVIISESSSNYWDMYYLDIKADTVCYVDSTPLSIDGEFAEKVIFEEVDFIVSDASFKPITTTRKHPKLLFRVDKNTFNGTFLWFNDFKYSLGNSTDVICREFSSTATYYGVTVDLDQVLPMEDGEFHIILDEPNKPKKNLCRYLLLSKLFFLPLNDIFSLHERISLKAIGNYSLREMNCTLISSEELETSSYFKFGINSMVECESYFHLNLTNEGNCANFELEVNQVKYILSVNIDVIQYRLSNNSNQWFFHKMESLWYTELTNELQVRIPNARDPYIILEGGKKSLGVPEKNYFKFALHEFNYEIKQKTGRPHYSITLYYHDIIENKGKGVLLMKIFSKLDVTKLNLGSDVNGVYIDATFSGNAALSLTIKNAETKEIIENEIVLKSGMNRLPSLKETETYILEKKMIEEDEFGFLGNVTLLGVETKSPIDYEKRIHKVPSYKRMEKPKF